MATASASSESDVVITGDDFFTSKKGWSQVKHDILSRYYNGWLPIMLQANYQPVYIDGFAGAGKYKDGTDGSPLLAYKLAVTHRLSGNFQRPVILYFIEKDPKRAAALKKYLDEAKKEFIRDPNYGQDKVQNVIYVVRTGTFREEMESLLTAIEGSYVAIFAFVDPFGYKGSLAPMCLMRKLFERATHSPTELFFNLMDGFARRFFNQDKKAAAINELLGVDYLNRWRESVCANGLTPSEKLRRFLDIYWNQLTSGFDTQFYKLEFSMCNTKNTHLYHLIFVTRHVKGLQQMKDAMWKQTQNSNHLVFSEFLKNKPIEKLNELSAEDRRGKIAEKVKSIVLDVFNGQSKVKGNVIEDYILTKTIYPFNVKNELKILLKDKITGKARSFDQLEFSFPNGDLDSE